MTDIILLRVVDHHTQKDKKCYYCRHIIFSYTHQCYLELITFHIWIIIIIILFLWYILYLLLTIIYVTPFYVWPVPQQQCLTHSNLYISALFGWGPVKVRWCNGTRSLCVGWTALSMTQYADSAHENQTNHLWIMVGACHTLLIGGVFRMTDHSFII